MKIDRVTEFLKEYWLSIPIALGLPLLICYFMNFAVETKATRFADLTDVIQNGKVTHGRIAEYKPYRTGFSGKQGIYVEEGVDVAIEYYLPTGQLDVFREIWNFKDGVADKEMIGKPVELYYYPLNKHIKAVSVNNREVQIYLKNRYVVNEQIPRLKR